MRSLSIGRSGSCDIVLADPTVSRRHAMLLTSEDGTHRFVDTSSLSGSYLYAEAAWHALTDAEVHVSDRLRLGDVVTTVAELLEWAASSRRSSQGSTIAGPMSGDTDRSEAATAPPPGKPAEPVPEGGPSHRPRTLVERDPATGRIVVRPS